MSLFKSGLAVALCAGVTAVASAQSSWPDRPIKLVVPYSAGAMGDVVARLVGEELQKKLGQPLIVDNKGGAGGNIGTAFVAKAAPDGYTFVVPATNNLVVNQFLFKNLGYDPLKAFDPVTMIVEVPSVLFMSAALPANDFKSFVEYARAHKGKLNYGSPGNGTTPHLSLYRLDKTLDLGMTHIPYSGSGPGMQALLANQVQVFMGGAGLGLQQVKAGKLRALAVSAPARLAALPDTPTFKELDVPLKASNWWALAAPHGTPPAIIQRMSEAVQEVVKLPSIRARFEQLGVLPIADGPTAMAIQLQEEVKGWERAVQESGAKIE